MLTIALFLLQVLAETWLLICAMAPYLLFGFAVAGLLSVAIRPEVVKRHLGPPGFRQTFKATLIGVPMPLCSCGVIPVAASLRRAGAGKGATAAFLASTPETGVDSLLATWGLLGPMFAMIRVVVAFCTGFLAGFMVDWLDPRDPRPPAETGGSGPDSGPRRSWLVRAFRFGFVVLPADIGRALLVGVVIAGVLGAVIPDNFLADKLGHSPLAYLVITAFAIPVYVCSTGSIPIAAAMMKAGLSPGTALVFLIAGPATNAATISILWTMLGRRTTIIYLVSIIACAWLAGGLVDLAPGNAVLVRHLHAHGQLGGWFYQAAGILLLGVLGGSFLAQRLARRAAAPACAHCAAAEKEKQTPAGGGEPPGPPA